MTKYLIILVGLLGFISCENELVVNAPSRDIPIVYGVLDATDTVQYIRLERVFQTEVESAIKIAKIADSLYYKDATVSLLKEGETTPLKLERVDGNLEGYPRAEGSFADAPNYLYKIRTEDIDFTSGSSYTLQIKRDESSPLVTAKTFVMTKPRLFTIKEGGSLHFRENQKFTFKRSKEDNGEVMDLSLDMYVRERDNNPGGQTKVNKYTWNIVNGYEKREIKGDGLRFFEFFGGALSVDAKIKRKLLWMDLNLTTGGEELRDYIKLGKANSYSITSSEVVPNYSNLTEGFGIFSSTYNVTVGGLGLSPSTIDSLEQGRLTKIFNFEQ